MTTPPFNPLPSTISDNLVPVFWGCLKYHPARARLMFASCSWVGMSCTSFSLPRRGNLATEPAADETDVSYSASRIAAIMPLLSLPSVPFS